MMKLQLIAVLSALLVVIPTKSALTEICLISRDGSDALFKSNGDIKNGKAIYKRSVADGEEFVFYDQGAWHRSDSLSGAWTGDTCLQKDIEKCYGIKPMDGWFNICPTKGPELCIELDDGSKERFKPYYYETKNGKPVYIRSDGKKNEEKNPFLYYQKNSVSNEWLTANIFDDNSRQQRTWGVRCDYEDIQKCYGHKYNSFERKFNLCSPQLAPNDICIVLEDGGKGLFKPNGNKHNNKPVYKRFNSKSDEFLYFNTKYNPSSWWNAYSVPATGYRETCIQQDLENCNQQKYNKAFNLCQNTQIN